MIERYRHLERVIKLLDRNPVVALLGPRQVGKTTLAREIARNHDEVAHFDLENPDDLARLAEPMLALGTLGGLVILDEVQLRPEIFPILRVLVDRPEASTRFLVLGSASPGLLRQGSETLAGRIAFHELEGFDLEEVHMNRVDTLWLRGGFPRSFLASDLEASIEWRRDFVRTFLERDLPVLGGRIPSSTLHRFWRMLAHWHGQVWNSAAFARSFGVSDTTVRRYLDFMVDALLVRRLSPWHENIRKRQVRSAKLYLNDSGLLHTLLGISTHYELTGHPSLGASWEGFVLAQLIRHLGAWPEECYFWSTHQGAELDLMIVHGGQRFGFEIKRTSAPRFSKSMSSALKTLKLDRLDVIHAGDKSFPIRETVSAVALSDIQDRVPVLRR